VSGRTDETSVRASPCSETGLIDVLFLVCTGHPAHGEQMWPVRAVLRVLVTSGLYRFKRTASDLMFFLCFTFLRFSSICFPSVSPFYLLLTLIPILPVFSFILPLNEFLFLFNFVVCTFCSCSSSSSHFLFLPIHLILHHLVHSRKTTSTRLPTWENGKTSRSTGKEERKGRK